MSLQHLTRTLLIFAHRAEAGHFLQSAAWQPEESVFEGLYRLQSNWLLITGEGNQAVSERLAAVCGSIHKQLDLLLNIGVCAALDTHITEGSIHSLRTVYRMEENRPCFHSFTSADPDASIDCISANRRITEPEDAGHLSAFAALLDREAWATGSVAHLFSLPFRAIKLVSDYADRSIPAAEIAQMAPAYSEKLYRHLAEAPPLSAAPPAAEAEVPLPEGFYATRSQMRQLNNLIGKLRLKTGHSSTRILEEAGAAELLTTTHRPKERTAQLVQLLSDQLNPFNTRLRKRLEAHCDLLQQCGCSVQFSRDYENDDIQLKVIVRNREQLQQLRAALAAWPYEKILHLLNGRPEENGED